MFFDLTQVRSRSDSFAGALPQRRLYFLRTTLFWNLQRRPLMRKPIFVCLLVFLSILLISNVVQAQSTDSATVNGRVTDPQGAVVANVTVTARSQSTGVERTASTTGSGVYTIPNLAA